MIIQFPINKQTYSRNSKFRRFVIAKLYQTAKNESQNLLNTTNSPNLSNTTNKLMKLNSEKNYIKILNRFITKFLKNKQSLLKEKLTSKQSNNPNLSLSTTFEIN